MLYAADNETSLITEFDKCPLITCVSYAGEDGSRGLLRWCDAKQKVAEILTRHTLIGAHTAYDCAGWLREWPEFTPLVWQAYSEDRIRDVQLEQKLDDIRDAENTKKSYSLASLVKRHYGVELDKSTHRLGFGPLRDVAIDLWPEGAADYALGDADWPLRLVRDGKIDGGPDKFRQARHGWWCDLMAIWGIQTDPLRVAKLKASLLARRDIELRILIANGIVRQNGVQDKKATQRRLEEACERLGVSPRLTDPSERFPGGQVSTDAEACRDSGDPVLEAMAQYGSIRKQLSTDVPNLERGEIHTKYDSLKDTGRIGSGGKDNTSPTGTAFNLTNMPRKGGIRECFVPRDKKVFFDLDYKALEAYTGAQACLWLVGRSSLADLLNAGKDYHINTAAGYLDIEYEEGMRRKSAEDPQTARLRQFCKIFNYSLAGGGGKKMIYGHAQTELKKEGEFELARSLTRDDSDRLWEVWRRIYDEWPAYFDRTASMTRNGGCQFEQLVSGRVRGVTGKGSYTEMNNGYFQGLGADAAKDAGWRVARECYDPTRNSVLFNSRLVLFGHDSLTGETDPEGGHDVAMRVKELMESVSEIWTPDVPLQAETTLATCYSKGAKAVYDKNNRLLPWSPKGE